MKKYSLLTDLEARLDRLPGKKADSSNAFNAFNGKNDAYYGSANGHIMGIREPLLRKKMEG